MATKIDFYLLNEPISNYLRSVCSLVEKLYAEKKMVWIKTTNNEQAKMVDDLLWTFHDTSFIPHELYLNSAIIPKAKIIVTSELKPDIAKQKECIFLNLSPNLIDTWQDFAHIIEIIPNDEATKSLARKRYKTYQDANAELNLIKSIQS